MVGWLVSEKQVMILRYQKKTQQKKNVTFDFFMLSQFKWIFVNVQ